MVATHYYNPDDDRHIKGISDPSKLNELYEKEDMVKTQD